MDDELEAPKAGPPVWVRWAAAITEKVIENSPLPGNRTTVSKSKKGTAINFFGRSSQQAAVVDGSLPNPPESGKYALGAENGVLVWIELEDCGAED